VELLPPLELALVTVKVTEAVAELPAEFEQAKL